MKKQIISRLLCVIMVISVLSGITFSTPVQKTEAAVSKITTEITEYAEGEPTTWKVLWVFPLTSMYLENGNIINQGDTLTEDDIFYFYDSVISDVEEAIYEYSANYMELSSDIIALNSLVVTTTGEEYMPSAEVVHNAVVYAIEENKGLSVLSEDFSTDLSQYDQVICCFQPENTTDIEEDYEEDYEEDCEEDGTVPLVVKAESGGRFAEYNSAYSVISLEGDLIYSDTLIAPEVEEEDEYEEDYVEPLAYYSCTQAIVGCIVDGLAEYISSVYPAEWAREMPITANETKYYRVTGNYDVMNDFYRDFFRGAVPVKKGSKSTWGMTIEDYKNNPSRYETSLPAAVEISTLEEWNNLCFEVGMGVDSTGSTITLTNNIDATGKEFHTLSELSGSLNGKGYAIIGAVMSNGGLIGTLKEKAEVESLLLVNATLNNKTSNKVGLLVDVNNGTIFSCGVVSGSLTAKTLCGGIAGISTGTINGCFNGAEITSSGAGSIAAGIVAESTGPVNGCYNYGLITSDKKGISYGIGNDTGTATASQFKSCYTLNGYAAQTHAGNGTVTTIDAATMASNDVLTALNKVNSKAFQKGNGYPAIKGAQYSYMTSGGSTLELATAETEPDEVIWAGGTAVKLITNLKASKWKTSLGTTKSGTVIWIVKNEPTELAFNMATHTVTTKSDATIATVSKGSVKGKSEGRVYVYAVETGSMSVQAFVVDVKAAPTTVATYYTSAIEADTVRYTSDMVPEGKSVKIYYAGITGTAKKGDWKLLTDEELTYTLDVPVKYKECISVTENEKENYFEVTVSEDAMTKFGKGKAFTVSLSLKNDQTGKKSTFKMIVCNPVNSVKLEAGDNTKVTSDAGMFVVTLDSAKEATQTGTIKETITLYNTAGNRTDSTKIIRIPHPEDYGFSATGAITLNGETTAEQNKVSIAAVKGESDTYTITAKKGTQPGTEAYFIIWHNSYGRTAGNGYQLIKVVVGEANHYASMIIDKAYDESPSGFSWQGEAGKRHLWTPSAVSEAQSFRIKEETVLADANKEATDYAKVYGLPCADGFTISTNGNVVVNGALTAGQKKVTMKAVSGSAGEYTITAAKGTPEGTEAYLLLYHNKDCYEVITVTVGIPNKVQSTTIDFATNGNSVGVKLAEDRSHPDGKVFTLSVPYNATKASTVTLTETRTCFFDDGRKQTDVNKLYRMPAADAFTVIPNESACTVTGTLTAAQKKISMSAVKNTTNFKVKVAKGTPVGTEVYFLIYHNYEGDVSGTGYQIVKVVITE